MSIWSKNRLGDYYNTTHPKKTTSITHISPTPPGDHNFGFAVDSCYRYITAAVLCHAHETISTGGMGDPSPKASLTRVRDHISSSYDRCGTQLIYLAKQNYTLFFKKEYSSTNRVKFKLQVTMRNTTQTTSSIQPSGLGIKFLEEYLVQDNWVCFAFRFFHHLHIKNFQFLLDPERKEWKWLSMYRMINIWMRRTR